MRAALDTSCNKNPSHRYQWSKPVLMLMMLFGLFACGTVFEVNVNNQQVYSPTTGASSIGVSDADLQGCINLAVAQQGLSSALELSVLSCANANISSVDGIVQLKQLRFLDLGENNISNLTPLKGLNQLAGLNVRNNPVIDIAPLFALVGLSSVNLSGNIEISCAQVDILKQRLGDNLTEPVSCAS